MRMSVRLSMLALAGSVCLLASSLAVVNPSFETLAPNFPTITCGGICTYNFGPNAIPGWTTDGGDTGALLMGGFNNNPGASDGVGIAWTNGGFIAQSVGPATNGLTYTLQVDMLHRANAVMAGIIELEIDGIPVAIATGSDFGPGTWATWTATYTATPLDDGHTLTINLTSNGQQGDFDNVRLNSAQSDIPEPATAALLGLGMIGLGVLRRRS